jgi:hypothetical protein
MFKANVLQYIRGFGGAIVRARAFHLWYRGFDSRCGRYDIHVKRVSQRSAESRGFSPGTPVSSHREVDIVGWDYPLSWD